MAPKYFSASATAVAASTSPEMTSVALLGTYQVRKNAFTSSSVAASRSSGEPIVSRWYGWSFG
jgi:hypothetical protein